VPLLFEEGDGAGSNTFAALQQLEQFDPVAPGRHDSKSLNFRFVIKQEVRAKLYVNTAKGMESRQREDERLRAGSARTVWKYAALGLASTVRPPPSASLATRLRCHSRLVRASQESFINNLRAFDTERRQGLGLSPGPQASRCCRVVLESNLSNAGFVIGWLYVLRT
jgi:hypothetical protein